MPSSQAFPDPFLVIRASAGTGKTYALSSRYISLLHRDVPPEEILATTFTRKAAGEILERILLRLARAATNKSDLQELAESIDDSSLSADRCRELLSRIAGSLHRLRVSTLDSFFAQLAGTHSLELGLPPGWQIADEQIAGRLQNVATTALLANNREGDVTRLMHLVGKGDAGRRVAELIAATVRDLHEKFQGSQEPAWQHVPRPAPLSPAELGELLEELTTTPLPTHKKIAAAHAGDLERVRAEEWEVLLDCGLVARVRDGESTYYRKDIPPETLDRYRKLLAHIRSILLTQLANQNQGTYDLLRKFDLEFERLKNEQRVLTFSDVKHQLTRQLALEDLNRWAFRMDGRITHLLLDEFQDTAPDQWQVIEPIARRIVSGKASTFFCVGDVKQAIYGWRGGEARIFDALEPRLGKLALRPLATSYRSAQVIIDVTNIVFQNLLRHNRLEDYEPAVHTWCVRFDPHETRWPARRGYVSLETAPRVDGDERQSAATLAHAADRIAQLVEMIPGRTFGVLLRKNESVGRIIYELGRRGVRASEEGQSAITDSAAVELILSLVHWIDNPGDSVALFHVFASPLAAVISFPSEPDERLHADFAARLRSQLATDGYGPTIAEWARQLVPHSSHREAARLRQLSQLAYDYQPQATLRPSDFAQYVRERRIEVPESVRVRVMTIHQAKGLEFDVVVLAELDEPLIGRQGTLAIGRDQVIGPIDVACLRRSKAIHKLLPQRLQQLFIDDDGREIAESLCRLYVGITRAAYALHMIIAPSRQNEKNLPKTAAALVRAALVGTAPVDQCQTLYELGDPRWFEHERENLPSDTEGEPEVATPMPIRLATSSDAGRRRHRTSPSQLELGAFRSPGAAFSRERGMATSRGTLLHALFQQIEWLDDGIPSESSCRDAVIAQGVQVVDWDDVWQQFRQALAAGPIADALDRAAYKSPVDLSLEAEAMAELAAGPLELSVRCEQRVAAIIDDQLLDGLIDRLVLLSRNGKPLAADVIDFKTDAISEGDGTALATRVEMHRPQLEAYRTATAQMLRLDQARIAARLLFTSIGRVVNC